MPATTPLAYRHVLATLVQLGDGEHDLAEICRHAAMERDPVRTVLRRAATAGLVSFADTGPAWTLWRLTDGARAQVDTVLAGHRPIPAPLSEPLSAHHRRMATGSGLSRRNLTHRAVLGALHRWDDESHFRSTDIAEAAGCPVSAATDILYRMLELRWLAMGGHRRPIRYRFTATGRAGVRAVLTGPQTQSPAAPGLNAHGPWRWTLHDIAAHFGVKVKTVKMWRTPWSSGQGFPAPDGGPTGDGEPTWLRETILGWGAASRRIVDGQVVRVRGGPIPKARQNA